MALVLQCQLDLFSGSAEGRDDKILIAIAEGADVNGVSAFAADVKSRPLHFAARSNSASSIHALCSSGARVEARNLLGQTPLHVAAEIGTANTVRALLRHGADMQAEQSEVGWYKGETAFTLALKRRGEVMEGRAPGVTEQNKEKKLENEREKRRALAEALKEKVAAFLALSFRPSSPQHGVPDEVNAEIALKYVHSLLRCR
mmetsp:Transcript_12408/g.33223  ORF Transcript_12408/g.33223 Transcript_12408/m.33223 type:complete len:202 (-) Transcript_12408:420-1025(-)|eukprot:CAMPEP_0113887604 /NCGR_PEP_ID=MMETSP0780_2-20120614/12316_1 /TAXON_ID=652834 /ORGANISM="Palpitomonas bilix" /LENGTH=201 /DNA_ID=CAMNT_0000876175 /DNA_START=141 /DNA_END=746 /DNA_ORIENTATION=- /assembly_acc=CAM_ASM_000599